MTIIDIKGIETNGIMAGAAEFGSMQVRGSGIVNNDFTVAGSLNVGIGGILTNGVLTVSGAGTSTFLSTVNVIDNNVNVQAGAGQFLKIADGTLTNMRGVVGLVQVVLPPAWEIYQIPMISPLVVER